MNSTRILFDLNFDTCVRKEILKLREIVTTVFVLNEINMKSNTTIQNLQGAGGGGLSLIDIYLRIQCYTDLPVCLSTNHEIKVFFLLYSVGESCFYETEYRRRK